MNEQFVPEIGYYFNDSPIHWDSNRLFETNLINTDED